MCRNETFRDWEFIWAFTNPKSFDIPRGRKVKIDTKEFFAALLSSQVWVGNSGIDRGLRLKKKGVVKVETWHGTPLKKILGDENQNAIGGKQRLEKAHTTDNTTIRCAQSEYDKKLFTRLFHADPSCILLSDLPRNDELVHYDSGKIQTVKKRLGIDEGKTVILYAPTYREYLINENRETYIAPPIHLKKWKERLGDNYILLLRAHYAVTAAIDISGQDFVIDVSNYPSLNDLYLISDLMISDYSSTFFDYSILDRPMFCFAYDLDEYEEKRGLYLNLEETLPCPVDRDEDSLLNHIVNRDEREYRRKAATFHARFAPYAGNASRCVVETIIKRLKG